MYGARPAKDWHAVAEGYGFRIDWTVLRFFVRQREPWLTATTRVVTALGSSGLIIPTILAIGLAWRARRKTWRPLVLLGLAYVGAEGLFQLVKVLVGRPRPPSRLAVGHFSGFGFPSGHATLSVAVWGMLAALVAGLTTRRAAKVAAWAAAVLISVLTGLTRLYLGAHWGTDVIGGWTLGALWLVAVLTAARPSVAGLRGERHRSSDGAGRNGVRPAEVAEVGQGPGGAVAGGERIEMPLGLAN